VDGRAVTLELLGTTETEIAYLAGIFDGEGYIHVRRYDRRKYGGQPLELGIDMATPKPLLLCQRIFGGKTRIKVPGPHYKVQTSWRVYGKQAEVFLRVVLPYLTVKMDKAKLSLSFLSFYGIKSSRKRQLAELISPHQTKNHDVNPDEQNTH